MTSPQRAVQAAPHASQPTQAGASAPAPTSHEPAGGWVNPATLAALEGCGFERGAGAASAGSVTTNDTAEKA